MIIKNNRTGMISIGYTEEGGTGSMNLIPGFNDKVDAVLYNKIKKGNGAVAELLADGILEEVHMEDGEENEGFVSRHSKETYEVILENKSIKNSIDDVSQLIEQDQLKKLIKKETRKVVLDAAKKQLKDLQTPAEHRSGDDSK